MGGKPMWHLHMRALHSTQRHNARANEGNYSVPMPRHYTFIQSCTQCHIFSQHPRAATLCDTIMAHQARQTGTAATRLQRYLSMQLTGKLKKLAGNSSLTTFVRSGGPPLWDKHPP
jgi:hypothetical protein